MALSLREVDATDAKDRPLLELFESFRMKVVRVATSNLIRDTVALTTVGGFVQLINLSSGEYRVFLTFLGTLQLEAQLRCFSLSPALRAAYRDEQVHHILYSLAYSNELLCANTNTGEVTAVMSFTSRPSFVFSDGDHIVCGDGSGEVALWTVEEDAVGLVLRWRRRAASERVTALTVQRHAVVCCLADYRCVVLALDDGSAQAWIAVPPVALAVSAMGLGAPPFGLAICSEDMVVTYTPDDTRWDLAATFSIAGTHLQCTSASSGFLTVGAANGVVSVLRVDQQSAVVTELIRFDVGFSVAGLQLYEEGVLVVMTSTGDVWRWPLADLIPKESEGHQQGEEGADDAAPSPILAAPRPTTVGLVPPVTHIGPCDTDVISNYLSDDNGCDVIDVDMDVEVEGADREEGMEMATAAVREGEVKGQWAAVSPRPAALLDESQRHDEVDVSLTVAGKVEVLVGPEDLKQTVLSSCNIPSMTSGNTCRGGLPVHSSPPSTETSDADTEAWTAAKGEVSIGSSGCVQTPSASAGRHTEALLQPERRVRASFRGYSASSGGSSRALSLRHQSSGNHRIEREVVKGTTAELPGGGSLEVADVLKGLRSGRKMDVHRATQIVEKYFAEGHDASQRASVEGNSTVALAELRQALENTTLDVAEFAKTFKLHADSLKYRHPIRAPHFRKDEVVFRLTASEDPLRLESGTDRRVEGVTELPRSHLCEARDVTLTRSPVAAAQHEVPEVGRARSAGRTARRGIPDVVDDLIDSTFAKFVRKKEDALDAERHSQRPNIHRHLCDDLLFPPSSTTACILFTEYQVRPPPPQPLLLPMPLPPTPSVF